MKLSSEKKNKDVLQTQGGPFIPKYVFVLKDIFNRIIRNVYML